MKKSVYTADKNRIQNLYTNMQRIAQVLDPNKRLNNQEKKRLPEDKSFLAHINNSLPNTIKPKAIRRELDNPTPG